MSEQDQGHDLFMSKEEQSVLFANIPTSAKYNLDHETARYFCLVTWCSWSILPVLELHEPKSNVNQNVMLTKK